MWREEERRVEDTLSRALARRVRVVVAAGPCDAERLGLSPDERARYQELPPWTALPWLAGRAALKRLLAELECDTDTSRLTFPDQRFSLSHAGELAVAVAVENSEGVGVDLERGPVDPGAARFFLRPGEIRWLRGEAAALQPAHAQRLWTVKEAVFKADAANHDGLLVDYELLDPRSWQGTARRPLYSGNDRQIWHYVSTETAWGICTVARQAQGAATAAAEGVTC